MSTSPLFDHLAHAHAVTETEADRLGYRDSPAPATPSVFGITFLGVAVEVLVEWDAPKFELPPCDCCQSYWTPWTPRYSLLAFGIQTVWSREMTTVLDRLLGHVYDADVIDRWALVFGPRTDLQYHIDQFGIAQHNNPCL